MSLQAVLFDLDGTLADTALVAERALRAAFVRARLAGDPPVEAFRELSGRSLEEIFALLDLPAELAVHFRSAATTMLGDSRLFPGAAELLAELRAGGLKIGVITGKERLRTVALLRHLKIDAVVQALVCCDDEPAPKPSPEGVWRLLSDLRVSPSAAVLVGDAPADLASGRSAGVRTVACLWGAGKPDVLESYDPWRTATTVGELAALLQEADWRPITHGPAKRATPRADRRPLTMAEVIVPGSKSMTNRALFLAAAASGRTELVRPLVADDTVACAGGLQAMGYDIETGDDTRWVVTGDPDGPPARTAEVFTRDGATGARFLPALAAAGHGVFHFDASPQMRARPMIPLLAGLRQLGAKIDSDSLPYTLYASGLQGGEVTLDAGISSQYLTALLLSSPLTRDGLTITVTRLVSAPYIEITLRLMRQFGAVVHRDGRTFRVEPGGYVSPGTVVIEPDASTASYFLAAAAVTGHVVTVPGLGSGSAQGDLAFAGVLGQMGATVNGGEGSMTLAGPEALSGVTVNMRDMSDTMPTLAAIAPLATGPVRVEDVYNTRVKECDRLQVSADNLRSMGVHVQTGEDWIEITPSAPSASTVATHRDHRIAMAFSVLSLKVPGIVLDNSDCVIKTCPQFHELLGGLTAAWEAGE